MSMDRLSEEARAIIESIVKAANNAGELKVFNREEVEVIMDVVTMYRESGDDLKKLIELWQKDEGSFRAIVSLGGEQTEVLKKMIGSYQFSVRFGATAAAALKLAVLIGAAFAAAKTLGLIK